MEGGPSCYPTKPDDNGMQPGVAGPGDAKDAGNPRLSEKSGRIDDEEQARRIADEDLHGTRRQTYSGVVLLWVAFQATGVIYGDISTSPLYVFSSTFSSQPSWDDLVGALSIVIWALTLIVTVKYTFIVLRADDDGQGGPFALFSLLSRHTSTVGHDSRVPLGRSTGGQPLWDTAGGSMDRCRSEDQLPASRGLGKVLKTSRAAQSALKVVGVVGVSLVLADGVLTPAQSVLGAIQGIRVANPALDTPAVVGISCAFLVVLFCLQPFGTARIGTAFAPIVTVWLLFNLCSGIFNLAVHDHTVLAAFSPHHALAYLVRGGPRAWRSLGGLLLAFTGVEALFADLGAFSRRAIQISWLGLAYPCLLVTYAGQAAFISLDASGTAFTNPFFYSVPPGTFYFGLGLAVLAAAVASQAMVTSVFQLLIQVSRLSYFPQFKIVHTSETFREQVFVPFANWLLMCGTVGVAAAFNNTTSLGNAYGVCVILVAFLTTCMVVVVALVVWRLPLYLVLPVFAVFAALDGAFLSAAFVKVPDGGWFTLLLALVLSFIFILWRFGKEAQWAAEGADPLTVSGLLTTSSDEDQEGDQDEDWEGEGQAEPQSFNRNGEATSTGAADGGPGPECRPRGWGRAKTVVRLRSPLGGTPVSTVPGLGIFFDKVGDPTHLPPSFAHFVRKFAARPSVIVFFHMRALPVPSVAPAGRFVVSRFAPADGAGGSLLPDAYVVVLRHGYTDNVLRTDLARDLVAQLQLSIMTSSPRRGFPSTPLLPPSSTPPHGAARDRVLEEPIASREAELREDYEMEALHQACIAQTVFVLGKEAMRVRSLGPGRPVWSCIRRGLLESFLWIRENSRTKLADLDIDVDKLVEVGFVKEI